MSNGEWVTTELINRRVNLGDSQCEVKIVNESDGQDEGFDKILLSFYDNENAMTLTSIQFNGYLETSNCGAALNRLASGLLETVNEYNKVLAQRQIEARRKANRERY